MAMNKFIAEANTSSFPHNIPFWDTFVHWKKLKEMKFWQVSFPYGKGAISLWTNYHHEIIGEDENGQQIIYSHIFKSSLFSKPKIFFKDNDNYYKKPIIFSNKLNNTFFSRPRMVFKDDDSYLLEVCWLIKWQFYIKDKHIYSFIAPSAKKEYCIPHLDLKLSIEENSFILKTASTQLNKIQIIVSYMIWAAYCRGLHD